MLRLLPAGDRPLRLALIGAHCDDVEIGGGGLLLDLVALGAVTTVDVLVATSDPAREEEARAALAAFCEPVVPNLRFGGLPDGHLPAHWGVVKGLVQDLARGTEADVVLAPSPADAHQDHRLLGELAPTAFRDSLILHYEIPKWDGDLGAGRPQTYWPLSAELVQRKYALLHEHYASQRGHHWFREHTFSALAQLRGMECRSDYAEAFSCPKAVLGWPAG